MKVKKAKKTFAYKVVRVIGRSMRSAIVPNSTRAVIYRMNRWSKPKEGYNPFLFTFRTLAEAKDFSSCHHGILKVQTKNPSFEKITSGGNFFVASHYPRGTIFADAVKPIRVIRSGRKITVSQQ